MSAAAPFPRANTALRSTEQALSAVRSMKVFS